MRCLAVIGVLLCAGPAAADTFGRYHALVIGNNDYQHLAKLETAVNDATAMAELLRERYGYTVTLLKDATRADILRAFNRFRAELTENDNLLVYYAGHGTLDRATDTGYWLPVDAEPDSDLNWVPNAAISRHLRGMTARHVMVIADSCYSGTLVRDAQAAPATGRERNAWLTRMAEIRSRTAITSGGLEPVVDAGGGGHSVFAGALLKALKANTEIIEGSALFGRISRGVVVNADQTPAYSDIRKAGHEGGEFLFVPRGQTLPGAAAETAALPATPADPAGRAGLETAFWQTIQNSDRPADFEAYLTQFPDGTFAALARIRLAALNRPATPSGGVTARDDGRLAAGTSFRDCDDCPEMVVIPPGRFQMGAAPGQPEAGPADRPQAGIGFRLVRVLEGARLPAGARVAAVGSLPKPPTPYAAATTALTALSGAAHVVTAGTARRLAPTDAAPKLGRLRAGDIVAATARSADGDWTAVARGEVALGFVPTAHLAEADAGHTAPGFAAGETIRDCAACPEMVVLPPGRVTMGADNVPVTIPRAFAIGKHEVTFDEWAACVADGACREARDNGWGRGKRPVVVVHWRAGLTYVRWLSEKTGKRYRLPSEAEWEYAARAGTQTTRYWGDDPVDACRFANVADRSRGGGDAAIHACDDGFAETAPVGSFAANAFGLYDMLGNASEWVDDCWNETLAELARYGAPHRGGPCGRRLLRGGSAADGPAAVQSGYRGRHRNAGLGGGETDRHAGLRVVRELE